MGMKKASFRNKYKGFLIFGCIFLLIGLLLPNVIAAKIQMIHILTADIDDETDDFIFVAICRDVMKQGGTVEDAKLLMAPGSNSPIMDQYGKAEYLACVSSAICVISLLLATVFYCIWFLLIYRQKKISVDE